MSIPFLRCTEIYLLVPGFSFNLIPVHHGSSILFVDADSKIHPGGKASLIAQYTKATGAAIISTGNTGLKRVGSSATNLVDMSGIKRVGSSTSNLLESTGIRRVGTSSSTASDMLTFGGEKTPSM